MHHGDWADSNERKFMCEIPEVIESPDTEVPRKIFPYFPQRVRHCSLCSSSSRALVCDTLRVGSYNQGCGVGVGVARSRGNVPGAGVGVDQTALTPTLERFV